MYRVDKRVFHIGELIAVNSDSYLNHLSREGLLIEKILESKKPKALPQRGTKLFLFGKLDDARDFSKKMSNSIIYKVDVVNTHVYYTADFMWTEFMKAIIYHEDAMKTVASLYWNPMITAKPIYETIVEKAKVNTII